MEHTVKLFSYCRSFRPNFSANIVKRFARLIRNFILAYDTGQNSFFKIFVCCNAIKEQIKACSEQAGMKSGQVMFSMRVALTGAPVTPGGAIEMAVVLKKDETMRRLKYSLQLLQNAQ